MPTESDCFVCRKHRGEIEVPGGEVYRDELVYVSHRAFDDGESTTYPGVVFVEPLRHVPGLAGLTRDEAERIGWLTSRVAAALGATTEAKHVYSAVLGHHVPHLHVWLVPRYPGTPENLFGVNVLAWKEAPRADAGAVEDLCDRLRPYLTAE